MLRKYPPIPWRQIKTKSQLLAVTIAVVGGAGLSPFAPGTAGSLVGIAMVWLLQIWAPFWVQFLVLALLIVIGSWAAQRTVELTQTPDHGSIVIDEVAGVLLGALFCEGNLTSLTIAFFVFRFFDILKLPPVGKVDRWSKSRTTSFAYQNGFGVVADDLVAGVQTLIVMEILQRYAILP